MSRTAPRAMPSYGPSVDHSMVETPRGGAISRILITGAGRGFGRTCAEVLASRGVELILCDKNMPALFEVAETLAAACFFCDVASEDSVARFAAELSAQYASLDMVINAAGGGYARTLGMYRMSRALMPMLRRSRHKLLLNIPPSPAEAEAAIFPYASSRLAFNRLSSALAFEARGTSVTVLIGCPRTRRLTQVLPDSNAGTWIEACDLARPNQGDVLTLAWQVAALIGRNAVGRLHAG